jgi:uncharacterized protein involved in exopolysaccharide biosynthesis
MNGGRHEGLSSTKTTLRRLIAAFPPAVRTGLGGALRFAPWAALVGVITAFVWPPYYQSTATFMAESQTPRNLPTGLGALAEQFGVASLTGNLGPAYYAKLLDSREVLERVLMIPTTTNDDSVTRPLIDRLGVSGSNPDRMNKSLKKLRNRVQVSADVTTNTVSLAVDMRDPHVAFQAANALLSTLDSFNVTVRKSRARNEAEFLTARVADAQGALRAAEASLESFLAANREGRTTPALAVQESRLRRAAEMAQTRFSDLQRQLDQARIQEVRDTPVLTVLDRPNLPVKPYKPIRSLVIAVIVVVGMGLGYGWARLAVNIEERVKEGASQA